jgi:hypothetical protein
VFMNGPCVVNPTGTSVEVFARANDGHIYRRAFDGRLWGTWTSLAGLDGTIIDARSDLDCSGGADTIHIVATGNAPVGALEHAFGFGTSYNPFIRELSPLLAAQSPSIIGWSSDELYLAWAGSGQGPKLFDYKTGNSPVELTPITSLSGTLVSAADIAYQGNTIFLAAFDSTAMLAIYPFFQSSAGPQWSNEPAMLPQPPGALGYSPTICSESGRDGSYSVNVAVVTAQGLWFAHTDRQGTWLPFSGWTMIDTEAASSPDCIVYRETPDLDAVIHLVVLSHRGSVVDFFGNGTSWVTTDLGLPPTK